MCASLLLIYLYHTGKWGVLQWEKEEFIYPLDIFHKTMENKTIQTELEAWLTFLSTDDPEQIYNIIQNFPIFREMYEDIFHLCQNTERVMDMFSKELAEMDHMLWSSIFVTFVAKKIHWIVAWILPESPVHVKDASHRLWRLCP